MAPLTQAEIKSQLLKSTVRAATICKYTELLGVRKLQDTRPRHGIQSFDGKPGEFYNASKEVAEVISKRYRSCADLLEKIKTNNNYKEQEVEDLIAKYGPVIWNDEDLGFVTETDDQGEVYQSQPRHLIYSNESDRVEIRTYTYCLVLQFTFSKMRGRPAHGVPVQTGLPQAASPSPELGQPNAAPLGPNTTFITSSVSRGGKRSRDANHHNVPVARMVPDTYTGGSSSYPARLQSTAVESALTMRNRVTHADQDGQAGETVGSDDPRIPTPPLDQVSSPNSDQEKQTGGHTFRNKRPRFEQGETALTNFRLKQLPESTRRTNELKRRDYSDGQSHWVRSSRPLVTTANAGDQEHTETAPERATNDNLSEMTGASASHGSIGTTQECDNDVIAVTNAQEKRSRLTSSATPAPETRYDEAISVQNSSRPSSAAENRESAEPTSLIVKLSLKDLPQVIQRSAYRRRLASQLAHALNLQNQHTQVLEDTVTLIADIRSLDTTLYRSPFGNRNSPYQLLLDQWLSLVAIYLTFRRATDFHDTQEAWNAHISSLPPAERWKREEPYHDAGVSFKEWRSQNLSSVVPTWSRDITCALLETAEWRRPLKTDDIQEMNRRVREFNSGLMAWLD
ncbi:hypothetical protein COCCADRAFT_10361 [Bipolaris zeicola 26-R-13]|uniref:Uncharacterized protein n=1 Tax=Cochliobolus carbonum (strain 26-R-13) TaxID=930089 RepID=W6Y6F4_COCC2|nr:uncharacterized protein COCCADRAFT_10361 [Bipolaris zeicola 26-R-13]EUC26866.1 hypothetical protein COCCADRAFT_10361 [Bipolaris zeicola 26-R-13]